MKHQSGVFFEDGSVVQLRRRVSQAVRNEETLRRFQAARNALRSDVP
jgi:hypothetical protein